jgi:hypothetical protein
MRPRCADISVRFRLESIPRWVWPIFRISIGVTAAPAHPSRRAGTEISAEPRLATPRAANGRKYRADGTPPVLTA